jgi:hypothetical protein
MGCVMHNMMRFMMLLGMVLGVVGSMMGNRVLFGGGLLGVCHHGQEKKQGENAGRDDFHRCYVSLFGSIFAKEVFSALMALLYRAFR